jgi:hypothetical protein
VGGLVLGLLLTPRTVGVACKSIFFGGPIATFAAVANTKHNAAAHGCRAGAPRVMPCQTKRKRGLPHLRGLLGCLYND